MANPHGHPVWYELHTPDHAVAKRFYEAVVGWTVESEPAGDMDYRMVAAGDVLVGGVMGLTDAVTSGGAGPGWLMYLSVDDVDATVGRVTQAGGVVPMPPFDLPGVGRMALVTDPGGAPFYIMKGSSEATSTAFSPGTLGHGSWHERWADDVDGALAFYRTVFGWENPETMSMGPMGGYHFVTLGDTRLGAIGPRRAPEQAQRWTIYFEVPDVDAAAAIVTAEGGHIDQGPHDVPGDQRIVIGRDPHGVTFALVAPSKGAER